MTEKSNRQIVKELRTMLTDEFPAGSLEVTKEWRTKMWRLLNGVEERMCPVDYRNRMKGGENG